MKVHIDIIHEDDNTNYSTDDMPKCPICGAKPYIRKDIVDGFYFGWSVGCPRYSLNDKVHGNAKLTRFNLDSKEQCIETWDCIVSLL